MLCCVSRVETMTTEDTNVNDIMTKLQHLQEVRYQRMCQWYHRSSSEADDVKGQSSAQPSTLANGLLQRLQHELVSLLSQDDAIFRQLLILRHSITQLKQEQQQQQQSCYCSDDEEVEEDLEVSYLSSTSSIATVEDRCRRHNGQPFFTSNRCVTCEHNINNSEDSAISLESSNLSSLPTSLAPSPTNDISAAPPLTDDIQPSTFHRHNVTYPPSRTNRHSRLNTSNVIKYRMDNKPLSRMCSVSIPSGVDGLGRTLDQEVGSNQSVDNQPSVTSSPSCKVRKTVSPLVQMLVRSRSITFLPRGALIRREESCDSGFHGSTPTTAGEIFV